MLDRRRRVDAPATLALGVDAIRQVFERRIAAEPASSAHKVTLGRHIIHASDIQPLARSMGRL